MEKIDKFPFFAAHFRMKSRLCQNEDGVLPGFMQLAPQFKARKPISESDV